MRPINRTKILAKILAGLFCCVGLIGCASSATPVADVPILPSAIHPSMIALYKNGIAQGNNPRVMSKLGDCMTDSPNFLAPLAENRFELGAYSSLKSVIQQFANTPARNGQGWSKDSFATVSLTSAGGFNVAGPLDPTWSDPKWCSANETPLACEYRIAKPSIAIIMFGTNDVMATEPKLFEDALRQIVRETTAKNILPILSTFPTRPENPKKSAELNALVVKIAQETNAPLINLNRALASLANQGVDPTNSTHLSLPANGRADVFTSDGLQGGANMRNLLTLQAVEMALSATK